MPPTCIPAAGSGVRDLHAGAHEVAVRRTRASSASRALIYRRQPRTTGSPGVRSAAGRGSSRPE